MKVKISYRAPTTDFERMPEFLYFEWLDVIEEIKEDINQYNEDEPTWVFFEEKEGVCIPSDYLLEKHDLLDEDNYHLEMSLKHTLRVFELLNEI
jgi:hypothetical protein